MLDLLLYCIVFVVSVWIYLFDVLNFVICIYVWKFIVYMYIYIECVYLYMFIVEYLKIYIYIV